MKPHNFNFQIAYADTDAGGIVYHARYIEIAERARMNIFKGIKDPDGGFVIRELSIKYKKPFRVGDQLVVKTRFFGGTAASTKLEQIFVKDGEEHAVMTGTAVYVNKDVKPARIPDVWKKYL